MGGMGVSALKDRSAPPWTVILLVGEGCRCNSIKAPEMRFVLGIVSGGSKSKAMFL